MERSCSRYGNERPRSYCAFLKISRGARGEHFSAYRIAVERMGLAKAYWCDQRHKMYECVTRIFSAFIIESRKKVYLRIGVVNSEFYIKILDLVLFAIRIPHFFTRFKQPRVC